MGSNRSLSRSGLAVSLLCHGAVIGAILYVPDRGAALGPGVTVIEVALAAAAPGAASTSPATPGDAQPADARPTEMAAIEPEAAPAESEPVEQTPLEETAAEAPPVEAEATEPPPPEPAPEPKRISEIEPTKLAEAMSDAVTGPEPVVDSQSESAVESAPVPRVAVRPTPKPTPPVRKQAVAKTTAEPVKPAPRPEPHETAAAQPTLMAEHPDPTGAARAAAPSETVQMAAAAGGAVHTVVTVARFRTPPAPPTYPKRAVVMSQEGVVLVRALIGADGNAREIRLWRSSGYALLDDAALKAVRGWDFEPARSAGRAITAWVEIPVNFQLR